MFTGLVEGQGQVASLTKLPDGLRLGIKIPGTIFPCSEIALGDSVALSGCCLTVVEIGQETLFFDAGQETLSKTNLGDLQEGHCVNIERALAVGDRLGGHFVQGHVDATGTVRRIDRSGDWVDMYFQVPPTLLPLMVPKGSITVDGISLTVVHLTEDSFSVALIPHTLEVTTLGQRQVGDRINLEADVLGKYVARLLQFGAAQQVPSSNPWSLSPDQLTDPPNAGEPPAP